MTSRRRRTVVQGPTAELEAPRGCVTLTPTRRRLADSLHDVVREGSIPVWPVRGGRARGHPAQAGPRRPHPGTAVSRSGRASRAARRSRSCARSCGHVCGRTTRSSNSTRAWSSRSRKSAPLSVTTPPIHDSSRRFPNAATGSSHRRRSLPRSRITPRRMPHDHARPPHRLRWCRRATDRVARCSRRPPSSSSGH